MYSCDDAEKDRSITGSQQVDDYYREWAKPNRILGGFTVPVRECPKIMSAPMRGLMLLRRFAQKGRQKNRLIAEQHINPTQIGETQKLSMQIDKSILLR